MSLILSIILFTIINNSMWICLPSKIWKINRMSQRTKEFPTKNSGDYNNQWNEITGQTDLN
jgi:hypothetical protein